MLKVFSYECFILALGNPDVHLGAPMVRSLLLAGPLGTGKKLLVNAICNETGANLFDLTATNIAGKYLGKQGTRLLMSMVFKVAGLLQPSVILVNDCERMFIKKVPKTDKVGQTIFSLLPIYPEVGIAYHICVLHIAIIVS